jgi:hypothetical protein
MWSTDVDELAVLIERAGHARSRARELVTASEELAPIQRRTLGACLVTRTAMLDGGARVTASRSDDISRLSTLVGRDTAIEDAKAAIASRYGVSRGEAFALLRHMSQTSNRKLRDVAHSVLEDEAKRPA